MLTLIASILFVFGPSCGGKSTFSKALVRELGPSWNYLDRDQLIEDGLCLEEAADAHIEEMIHSFRLKNQHVVIDAQIPWRAPQKEDELTILIHAPLEELLFRDARRTALLQRPPQRAYYARLYVEETFVQVFQAPIDLGFTYDLMLDSSQHSVDREIQEFLELYSPFLASRSLQK